MEMQKIKASSFFNIILKDYYRKNKIKDKNNVVITRKEILTAMQNFIENNEIDIDILNKKFVLEINQ